MKLDIFSLIVLLGALQALFFGTYLLFAKSSNKLQRRALAYFILILSYNGFETLNWSSELYRYHLIFEIIPFVLVFGLGPSIYLYIRSFRTSVPVIKPWRHFIIVWVLLACRIGLIVVWMTHREWSGTLFRINDKYGYFAEPLSVLSFIIYVYLAFGVYRKLRAEQMANDSWMPEVGTMILRWLKTLMIVMVVFGLAWFLTVVYGYIVKDGSQYYVIELLLVVFIYWIGFTGYQRTKVIYITQQKKAQSYYDSLPLEEIKESLVALEKAMLEDKLYLDPELNITTLSDRIGIPAKFLSAVLNQRLNKGFNEYVNAYRVEAVKVKILDPGNGHLTISGMAYECGFNSQPTFQRAFKAVTGMTPREFQAKNMEKPE